MVLYYVKLIFNIFHYELTSNPACFCGCHGERCHGSGCHGIIHICEGVNDIHTASYQIICVILRELAYFSVVVWR